MYWGSNGCIGLGFGNWRLGFIVFVFMFSKLESICFYAVMKFNIFNTFSLLSYVHMLLQLLFLAAC